MKNKITESLVKKERIEEKSPFSKGRMMLAVTAGLLAAFLFIAYQINSPVYYASSDGNYKRVFNESGETVYIVSDKGDFAKGDLIDVLAQIDWDGAVLGFVLLALLFMVFRDLAYAKRLQLLSDHRLTFIKSLRSILVWEFASALSPGVVGGSAVAMFIIRREGLSLGKSTGLVMVTAMLDNLYYVLFALAFGLSFSAEVLFGEGDSTAFLEGLFWLGYALITAFTLFIFALIFLKPNWIATLFVLLSKVSFLKRFKTELIATGIDLKIASREYGGKSVIFWLKAFGFTAFSWLSRFLVVNALIMAFSQQVDVVDNLQILAKQFVMWLVMLLPTTPGASGVAEFLFSEMMAPFFGLAAMAVITSVVWRVVSYFPYIIIGLVYLPVWVRKTASKQRV